MGRADRDTGLLGVALLDGRQTIAFTQGVPEHA